MSNDILSERWLLTAGPLKHGAETAQLDDHGSAIWTQRWSVARFRRHRRHDEEATRNERKADAAAAVTCWLMMKRAVLAMLAHRQLAVHWGGQWEVTYGLCYTAPLHRPTASLTSHFFSFSSNFLFIFFSFFIFPFAFPLLFYGNYYFSSSSFQFLYLNSFFLCRIVCSFWLRNENAGMPLGYIGKARGYEPITRNLSRYLIYTKGHWNQDV